MEDMLYFIPYDKLEFCLKEIIFEKIPFCFKKIKDKILVCSKLILLCQGKVTKGYLWDYDYLFQFDKNVDGTINFAYIIRKSKSPEIYEELDKDSFIIRYRNICRKIQNKYKQKNRLEILIRGKDY